MDDVVTVEPTVDVGPTAEAPVDPEPTAAAVDEPAPLQVISGRTVDGAYFYGNPAAPVTLYDYSDFL